MASRPSLEREDRDLVEQFEGAGQGHVFRFLADLGVAESAELLADARTVDLDLVGRLASRATSDERAGTPEPPGDELHTLDESDRGRAARDAACERGEREIREGRVAVVVAAGGQGTRLGGTAPKAGWPVGPLTGKPLLQWHAEKVLFWSRRAGRPLPLVLLVSDATAPATEDLLRWHRWFGLDPTWVRLAKQRSLPAVDHGGRILLATRSRIALAPNGHGGLFAALRDAKLLDLLGDHGVRTLAYCQVDNPLIRTVDPVFVGFHAERASEFSSKSVSKRSAAEKVGVFARVAGRAAVVEYSELTDEQSNAPDGRGGLLFGQGNIAAHCVDLDFARRAAGAGLPYHRAAKKVPYVDDAGRPVTPAVPNATKFETFIFDALPMASRTFILETRRDLEFSPIKNSEGEDTPETARRDLVALFRGWYERAGVPAPAGTLEVSPAEAPDEAAFRRVRGLAS